MNDVSVAVDEQPSTAKAGPRRWFPPAVKSWLREPLLHFLLIGVALLALYNYTQRGRGGVESSRQIQLTMDELVQMNTYFVSQWKRSPSPAEMQAMVADRIREEILYREALAMGLDKDDTIVKRRLAQKMQFLAEDVAAAHQPSAAELKSWFEKNSGKFALPSRYSFRHLYFSTDRRGQRAQADAAAILRKLAGQPADSKLAAPLADRFMFQDYYADRAPSAIAKEFGPPFALALAKAKPGSWQGPIESGFGWHLVFVDTAIPGRVPAMEEVESEVRTAWLNEQKETAWQKAWAGMRAKYTVLLPGLPEGTAAASGEGSR
jgi:peptidyl-prolyl cis-trans isomerase C